MLLPLSHRKTAISVILFYKLNLLASYCIYIFVLPAPSVLPAQHLSLGVHHPCRMLPVLPLPPRYTPTQYSPISALNERMYDIFELLLIV